MQDFNSSRLSFLDLFRGAFALVMLEGHTLRALLDPTLKTTALYQYQELIHNLPGPAFLFASGVAFSFATLPNWDAYKAWSTRSRRRFLRLSMLLVLGYMLHLPYFSLRRILSEATPEQISFLLSADILQCIAISGMLLQILPIILSKQKWFFTATALGCVSIALATPFFWDISKQMPLWAGTTLAGNWGSVFPLFPYIGFGLAGAAWGALYVLARHKGGEANFLRQTCRFSLCVCACSLAAAFLPLPQAYSDFWTTSPLFFSLRVAILALLAVAFRWAEPRILPHLNVLVVFGRESLMIYTVHLLLLHGSAVNPETNLLKVLGNARPLTDTTFVLLFLIAITATLAWTWRRLKENYVWGTTGIQLSIATYLTYCFLKG